MEVSLIVRKAYSQLLVRFSLVTCGQSYPNMSTLRIQDSAPMPKVTNAAHYAATFHTGKTRAVSLICTYCRATRGRSLYYREGHHIGACVSAANTAAGPSAVNAAAGPSAANEAAGPSAVNEAAGPSAANAAAAHGAVNAAAGSSAANVAAASSAAGYNTDEEYAEFPMSEEMSAVHAAEVIRRLMNDPHSAPATEVPQEQQDLYTARAGTAEWYIERADHPLYANASMTVIQAVYLMLQV